MRFLVYSSYTDLKGKEQLIDATIEKPTAAEAMNKIMLDMGNNGYTDRSIDQIIPMTPKWKAQENKTNIHVDVLIDRSRGKHYTDYEKDFMFEHYSKEGPEYCAKELDLKESSVKAYVNRMRRLILENSLDLPIEAFTPPKTKELTDNELTQFNQHIKFGQLNYGG